MKVPTKHGLDRKFKPWRKGKSTNSNKRSSLKQQLRGQERLLAKILKSTENPSQKNEHDQKIEDIRKKIAELKREISQKQQSITEKKHAEKSHGQRFLDRQRLTRLEKKVRKTVTKDREEQLFKIALDQIYVAHHPNDIKYMPLFKYGKRVIDQSRQLFRRAVTRKRILRDLKTTTKVNWISTDQYKRLPKGEWTIQDEERVFGGSVTRRNDGNTKSLGKAEDSRFTVASSHEALLKAADQAESDLLRDEDRHTEKNIAIAKSKSIQDHTVNDSSSSSSESSSDSEEEEPDPLSSKHVKKSSGEDSRLLSLSRVKKSQQNIEHSDSSSDSDSNISEDSDRDIDELKQSSSTARNSKRKNENESSSSDSSSSSSSDSSDDEADKNTFEGNPQTSTSTPTEEVVKEEIDDFLIDETDNHDVFDNPAVRVPALSTFRGDKSKGFETQSQRPGEYKKKRIRRY